MSECKTNSNLKCNLTISDIILYNPVIIYFPFILLQTNYLFRFH